MRQSILAVDGYNIIHAWPDLREWMNSAGLQAARDKLCDRVHDYAVEAGLYAIVVFDAHHTNRDARSSESYEHMDVVYTSSGETADHYIERLAFSLKDTNCVLYVATADSLEQSMILGRGAHRLSPRELLQDMQEKRTERKNPGIVPGSALGDRISRESYEKLERMRRGEDT